MSRTGRRAFLLGVAFVGFIGLGLPDGLLGPSWPFVRVDLGRPIEDLGLLIAVGTISSGATAAMSGNVSRRLGTGGLLIVATVVAALGAAIWAVAPTWPVFVAGSIFVGLGAGLFDPGINHYVARNHGARSMSVLHLTFGLGATIGPVVMITAVDVTGTWRWGLASVLLFFVPLAGVVAGTRSSWGRPVTRSVRAGGRLPEGPRVARTLAAFAMSTGIEVAGGQWAFSILQGRGLGESVAASFVAAYWGGLTGGRLIGAVAGERLRRRSTLAVSVALLAVGHAIFWLDPFALGSWGLPVAGAGTALVFPTLVLVTEETHGDGADVVMGWGFAAAATGAASLPWLAGVIGARTSLDAIPLVILAAVGVFTVILLPYLRSERASPRVLHSNGD